MGSDSEPTDERPAHQVLLPAFAIDRTPVTNSGFAEFLDAVGPRHARRRARLARGGDHRDAPQGWIVACAWGGASQHRVSVCEVMNFSHPLLEKEAG